MMLFSNLSTLQNNKDFDATNFSCNKISKMDFISHLNQIPKMLHLFPLRSTPCIFANNLKRRNFHQKKLFADLGPFLEIKFHKHRKWGISAKVVIFLSFLSFLIFLEGGNLPIRKIKSCEIHSF